MCTNYVIQLVFCAYWVKNAILSICHALKALSTLFKNQKNTNNKSHNLISVSLHKGLLLNCNQIVKEIPRNTKKKSPDMRPEIVLPQDMFNLHDNG